MIIRAVLTRAFDGMTRHRAWRSEQLGGVANALAAAVLFGLSAPAAKVLLVRTGPLLLASLLYLGAGFGLLIVGWLTSGRGAGASSTREAPLRGADFPILAAVAAVPLLGEMIGAREAVAGGGMALGVALLLFERHAHLHDEHHQHEHPRSQPGHEPHSHVHVHEPLSHAHPHVSDVHHRHRH